MINFLTMMVESNNNSSLITYCHRRNQLHYEAMKEIIKPNMVIRLPNLLKPTTQCERCILRKQALTHFPNDPISKSKEILDLVHTNLRGPKRIQSNGDVKYFVLAQLDFYNWKIIMDYEYIIHCSIIKHEFWFLGLWIHPLLDVGG
jgi:hypothetical protein